LNLRCRISNYITKTLNLA